MEQGQSPRGAIAQRLDRMGLCEGDVVAGWTLARISPSPHAIEVRFVRGSTHVDVRLAPASDEKKRLTRVGRVDLSHLPVEEPLARHAGVLTQAVAARLARYAPHAELGPLLPAPPPEAPRPEPAAKSPDTASAYHDSGEAPDLVPAKMASSERPFMRFHTLDVGELHRFPDALRRMYDGTLGGLVIQNVYPRDFMATVMARLKERDADFPRTSFPAKWNAHFYGRCLDGNDPGLDAYLRDAERFRAELAAPFDGGRPFEARMEEVFDALAGGLRTSVPRFTDGRAYTPATIRILLEGGQIGVHCGNEAATRQAYTHLNTVIDRHDQLSYFLTLQEPEAGGELIVYSLKWSDIDASHIVAGRSRVEELLADAEWMAVRPRAGDLLVFDGGRYFHRVAKVEGRTPRWTIGGFMMWSREGDAIYYWS